VILNTGASVPNCLRSSAPRHAAVTDERTDPLLARLVGPLSGDEGLRLGRLREHREAAGLSIDALARRAGVGWHTVKRAEEGAWAPRGATVAALAAALGLDPADLVAPGQAPAAPRRKGGGARAARTTADRYGEDAPREWGRRGADRALLLYGREFFRETGREAAAALTAKYGPNYLHERAVRNQKALQATFRPLPGLRRTREQRRLTMRALAQAAGVGYRTIGRIEEGYVATPRTLAKLADALGVDEATLVGTQPSGGRPTGPSETGVATAAG
jgi:transcriptional regulator with XRE-family HTH domain